MIKSKQNTEYRKCKYFVFEKVGEMTKVFFKDKGKISSSNMEDELKYCQNMSKYCSKASVKWYHLNFYGSSEKVLDKFFGANFHRCLKGSICLIDGMSALERLHCVTIACWR